MHFDKPGKDVDPDDCEEMVTIQPVQQQIQLQSVETGRESSVLRASLQEGPADVATSHSLHR